MLNLISCINRKQIVSTTSTHGKVTCICPYLTPRYINTPIFISQLIRKTFWSFSTACKPSLLLPIIVV
jgi:hypothetical protein